MWPFFHYCTPSPSFFLTTSLDKSVCWVDLVDFLVHFHQLWRRCYSSGQLQIVELHLYPNHGHKDVSDDPWLIFHNRCCQRALHLISSLDIETIEWLVDSFDQQSKAYLSLCRWGYQSDNLINPINFLSLDYQRWLFHSFLPSSIRRCDDSHSHQWQYFDYHDRCVIHVGSRI